MRGHMHAYYRVRRPVFTATLSPRTTGSAPPARAHHPPERVWRRRRRSGAQIPSAHRLFRGCISVYEVIAVG